MTIERVVYVGVESTRIIEGLPREVTGGQCPSYHTTVEAD